MWKKRRRHRHQQHCTAAASGDTEAEWASRLDFICILPFISNSLFSFSSQSWLFLILYNIYIYIYIYIYLYIYTYLITMSPSSTSTPVCISAANPVAFRIVYRYGTYIGFTGMGSWSGGLMALIFRWALHCIEVYTRTKKRKRRHQVISRAHTAQQLSPCLLISVSDCLSCFTPTHTHTLWMYRLQH